MTQKFQKKNPARAEQPALARVWAWERLAGRLLVEAVPTTGAASDGTAFRGLRRDRAQADHLARGVLRRRGVLDWLIARGKSVDASRTSPELMWVIRLAVFERVFQSQGVDYAIVDEAVSLVRCLAGVQAAGFVNAALRALLPGLPHSEDALRAMPEYEALRLETKASTPKNIITALAEGYGRREARAVVEAFSDGEAPIWVRVNRLRPEDGASATISANSEALQPLALADAFPEARLWTSREVLPWESVGWAEGRMTVQDLAAMLAARLLAPEPGMRVLDLCAAPGGKAGHLWEMMRGTGTLVAAEIDEARRIEMRRALLRLYGVGDEAWRLALPAGMSCVAPHVTAGLHFDRVLVDAPCMALGLIRRHPEARWDGRLSRGEAMSATQRAVLAQGAGLVTPGGRLLWATCSPTRDENELVIADFLRDAAASGAKWRCIDPREVLAEAWLPFVQVVESRAGSDEGSGKLFVLRTRPDKLDCDGFAYILLERAG